MSASAIISPLSRQDNIPGDGAAGKSPASGFSAYPIQLTEIFQRILARAYGPCDEAGLPLVDYDALFAKNRIKHPRPIGVHYTPVTLAFFGLGHFAQADFTGPNEAAHFFRRTAEWFVVNQNNARGTGGAWPYFFPMPHLPALIEYRPGMWISAMAQGLGASVLLRAYHAFGEDRFLRAAASALRTFQFSIFAGGAAFDLQNGRLFLEEFPMNPPMHVLNGALFAVIGLAEFLQIINDAELGRVYHKALSGLRWLLPRFDAGYGSFYDLRRRQIANAEYHDLHVQLLHALGELAEEKEFQAISLRWRAYRHSRAKRSRHWLAERAWAVRRRFYVNAAR